MTARTGRCVLIRAGCAALTGRPGCRRFFLAGVLIFGAASAVCAAAVSSSMLVASRFVQGTGEALAGPAALGMIPVLFPDSRERMKALESGAASPRWAGRSPR